MNLTVPDKLHKFLVLIGSILVAFIYFQKENVYKEYENRIDSNNRFIDSIEVQIKKLEFESKEMVKYANSLSLKHNVENPLKQDKKLNLEFSRVLKGSESEVMVSDSIQKYWNKYGKNEAETSLLIEKSKIIDERLNEEREYKNDKIENLNSYENIGMFFLVIGLLMWIFIEFPVNNEEIEHYSKKIEDRTYRECQSCGNRFTSLRKYGKEITGENNYAFCSSCYENGKFTNEELTFEDVVNDIKKKIKKKDWIERTIILNRIKKLERWNR